MENGEKHYLGDKAEDAMGSVSFPNPESGHHGHGHTVAFMNSGEKEKTYRMNHENLFKLEPDIEMAKDVSQIFSAHPKKNFTDIINSFIKTIMNSDSFKFSSTPLQQQIQHLSFMVNMWSISSSEYLLDIIVEEHINVLDQIRRGLVAWDNAQQFRDWEQNVLMKLKKDEPESEPEGEDLDKNTSDHDPGDEDEDEFIENEFDNGNDYQDFWDNDVKPEKRSYKRKKYEYEDTEDDMGAKKRKKKWVKDAKRCDGCNFVTSSQKKYDRHMFELHEQTMCNICGMNFTGLDFTEYFSHTLEHRDGPKEAKIAKAKDLEPKMCPHCGVVVKHLWPHIKYVHEKAGHKKCPHCDYVNYGKALKNHIKFQHTSDIAVNCPWCGKYMKNLQRHLNETQCNVPEEERKVKPTVMCEYCHKVLKTKKSLKQHIQVVHASADEMFQCDQCSFKSKYKPNLRMHIKTVHERRSAKEVCPKCNKTCVNLEWHLENYHNIGPL